MGFFAPSTYWKSQPDTSFGMFGAIHISVIVLLALVIVALFVFGGRISHKSIKRYLLVSFFVWSGLEIFKLILFLSTSLDSYQAVREVLPLYLCSLFIYSLPLAVFCRGRLKKIGGYSLCTLCLISGLLTTINCPVLNSYPSWSFYSLHSLLYHAFMTVTGVLMIVSGYVELDLRKFYYPLLPVCVLAVPAIIVNNLVYTDYMLMRFAWGTPVLDGIAQRIGQVPQIFLMLFVYALLSFLMTGLGIFVIRMRTGAKAE